MRWQRLFWLIVALWLVLRDALVNGSSSSFSSSSSSDNIVDDRVSVNTFTPNQFYKVCPSSTNDRKAFGQPTCGDGTPFCFYVSRPTQRNDNKERILIEIMGGGGCWNMHFCNKMAKYLTFPEELDKFLGLSCSELNYGLQQDGKEINMLCGQTIGETDFSSYNTIVVPYCTQDVHIGSNIITYDGSDCDEQDDDGGYRTVRHMGSHNIMSFLRWVYANFPNAKHIALTGCSAGGTAVPIVYDLLRKHYNHFGVRKVQINSIIDSPVYLTPSYFLENVLDLWNPWPLLKRIGFDYEKYRYSEEYPTQTWDYILRNGANRDKWGFVSHTYDQVSQKFYWYMSGNKHYGRRQLLDQDDLPDQWLSELSSSLDTIQAKHDNVQSYWIDDYGHCTFGLYYALQNDGFADWASKIFQETAVPLSTESAVVAFAVSALLGLAAFTSIVHVSRRVSQTDAKDVTSEDSNIEMPRVLQPEATQNSAYHEKADSALNHNYLSFRERAIGKMKGASAAFLMRFSDCPVTAGLGFIITVFFWIMIINVGFAHPLNNPSLGPSAIGLSKYGINNPSLILYEHQWFRIVSASFLCSGVLTYFITIFYLAFTVRSLENSLGNPVHTVWVCALVALGINLFYASLFEGASCSSLALVLGLQSCHFVVRQRRGQENRYIVPVIFMVLTYIVSFLFLFNDHWMMLASIFLFGPAAAWFGFKEMLPATDGLVATVSSEGYVGNPMEYSVSHSVDNRSSDDRDDNIQNDTSRRYTWRKGYAVPYGIWFLLVAFGLVLKRPRELYVAPFYTGCELYYSTEVASAASRFYDSGNRRLEEAASGNSMCAEFCVPSITSRFVQLGVSRIGIAVEKGQCKDLGYTEHVADKTFSYMSYSLDVEVYYSSS